MRAALLRSLLVVIVWLSPGCGGEVPPPDAAGEDAGVPVDARTAELDASEPLDANTPELDAGPLPCAAGTARTDSGACEPCAAGEFCAGGSAPREACGSDSWDHDAEPSTPCASRGHCTPGESVIDDGSATTDRTCAECPPETFSATTNASSCAPWTECAAGSFVSGAPSSIADRVCTPCASGEWDDDADPSTACILRTTCSPGQFVIEEGTATADRTCADCPPETFSATMNASSCAPWTECAAGSFVSGAPSSIADRVCTPCASGEWDDDADPSTTCILRTTCSPGQFVIDYGNATTDRRCGLCGYGYFSTTTNQDWCEEWTACLAGTYVFAQPTSTADRVCMPCPSETYSVRTNITSCTPYTVCGPGHVEGTPGTATSDRVCVLPTVWTRQFGGAWHDGVLSVRVDGSGNVIVAGYMEGAVAGTTSAGGYDAFVRKYDASGNELWTRRFGTVGDDSAAEVAVDAMGRVIVAGRTQGALPGQTSAGGYDAFVRMYSPAGTEVWTRQLGTSASDLAASVAVAASGSVVVTGSTGGTLPGETNAGVQDAFVVVYDASGTLSWTDQIGTAGTDSAMSVNVDGGGNVLVSGYVSGALPGHSYGGYWDAFVRMYDVSGTVLWTHQFGGIGYDTARSVAVDGSGSLLVAGGLRDRSTGLGRAFVRKYDASGSELWTRQIAGSMGAHATSVSVGGSGTVLVAGEVHGELAGHVNSGRGSDVFMRIYDASGTELWTRQLGSSTRDEALSVSHHGSSQVLVAGRTTGAFPGWTHAGSEDAFVMMLAP